MFIETGPQSLPPPSVRSCFSVSLALLFFHDIHLANALAQAAATDATTSCESNPRPEAKLCRTQPTTPLKEMFLLARRTKEF